MRLQGRLWANTDLSNENFVLASQSGGIQGGSVVEVFLSASEAGILNFVLLLPVQLKEVNTTFLLTGRTFSVNFACHYLNSDQAGVRSIKDISVTRGTILGGTAVVLTLRCALHFIQVGLVPVTPFFFCAQWIPGVERISIDSR